MGTAHVRRVDLLAVIGGAILLGVAVGYVLLMREQGDDPVLWTLGLLAVLVAVAAYGADRTADHRRPVLLVGAAVAFALGILSLFSIGLAILVASVCLAAASDRARSVA